MPFPTSLQLPEYLIGSYLTYAGKNYSVSFDFPKDDSGKQAAEVGLLFTHASYSSWDSIATIWGDKSILDPIPNFAGDGGNAYAVFFLNCVINPSNQDQIYIAYADAEGSFTAGTLQITKVEGSQSAAPTIDSQRIALNSGVNEKIGYPFWYDLQNWPKRAGYNGTVSLSIQSPLQKGVVVCVFDGDGSLLGLFDQNNKKAFNISMSGQKWICSFLVPEKQSKTKGCTFIFDIGDPRNDGTMEIDEV